MKQMTDFQRFIKVNKLKQKQVAEYLGTSTQYINQVVNGKCDLSDEKWDLLVKSHWDISMLKVPSYISITPAVMTPYPEDESSATPIEQREEQYVPMLPLQAIGGALAGFDGSATLDKCERVLSPIQDIDFAMEVYGDSMSPDYPSGARIFVKRIDMKAFIEWGRVYVLDTVNGSIVKEIFPSSDTAIECRSINPAYPPFIVQLKDVRAMYRVLMSMQMK